MLDKNTGKKLSEYRLHQDSDAWIIITDLSSHEHLDDKFSSSILIQSNSLSITLVHLITKTN